MKNIFIFLVKIYRKFISPLKPPCCKYYPTCSSYAVDAFKKHGTFKGLLLSSWRILRCNPWSLGGIDPVPDEFILFGKYKNNEKKIYFGKNRK